MLYKKPKFIIFFIWITHIFVLVAAIVFILFLLRLAYRYATDQPVKTRRRRLAASFGLGLVALLVVIAALAYVNRDLRNSSVTAAGYENDQNGEKLAGESSKQYNQTAGTQGTVESAIVEKAVSDAKPSFEIPNQQSPPIFTQKLATSDQESSLDPASDTGKTTLVKPEAGNTLDTVEPALQPETVSNKDMVVERKKETLVKAATPPQKLQSDVSPSTSEDRTQSKSGYKQIITKHFLFDPGGWQLKPETHGTLDELVDNLKKNESLKMLIQGHSDSRGSENLNKKLSDKRAEAVAAYLVRSGVPSHRLTTVGYGSSQPVATNETPEGRAQNRRVVIKTIVKVNP